MSALTTGFGVGNQLDRVRIGKITTPSSFDEVRVAVVSSCQGKMNGLVLNEAFHHLSFRGQKSGHKEPPADSQLAMIAARPLPRSTPHGAQVIALRSPR